MTWSVAKPAPPVPANDAVALLADVPLTEDEAGYVEAARAANTFARDRSDWAEFAGWAAERQLDVLPAGPATISGYLSDLARHGAKVGTMSRRLSVIRFAHRLQGLPDPCEHARVVAVWEGIRRTHGAPPEQAAPLMPPELFHVLDACPVTKTWRTKGDLPNQTLPGPVTGRCCWSVSSPHCAAANSPLSTSRTSASTLTALC